jgi:hypothetical protein
VQLLEEAQHRGSTMPGDCATGLHTQQHAWLQ